MGSENVAIDYASVLADLRAKRDKIDAAIAGIEAMLGATAVTVGHSTAMDQNGTDIQSDSFFGLSIADAAKKFLSMKKKPQTTQDIAIALEEGGMTHASGNWANTVGAGLNRIDNAGGEIIKVKRGIWGLATWYPGRKRQQPKEVGTTAEDETHGGE